MAKITGVGRNGVGWSRTGGTISSKSIGNNTWNISKSMYNWRIDGIQEVSENINAALALIKARSAAGLTLAAKYVLNDADSGTSPLVPEDLGPLRASHFQTSHTSTNGDPYVRLGYNANYAAAVHEMMESPSGKPINWTRPGSGPKFLEASLKRNEKKILEIVKTTI